MAIRFFQKLFKKHKKGHIGLTAEEAYAPLVYESDFQKAHDEDASYVLCDPENTDKKSENEHKHVQEKAAPLREEAPSRPEEKNDKSPISVWMYGYVEEPASARTLMRCGMISAFRSVNEDETGFLCGLKNGSSVSVSVCTDQDIVSAQAGYLISRFKNTYLTDRDVQNAALMQIEVFNAYAEFVLQPPYSAEDANSLFESVCRVAETVCGFVLNEKTELFRWDKRLLISQDGRTDFTEFMPIRRSGQNANKAEQDAADAARRARSIELLKKHGIETPAEMPVQIPEASARLRSPEEIVDRLVALFACALKAQAFSSPRDIQAPQAWVSSVLKRLDNQYGVNRLFTGKEAEYIVRGRDSQHPAFLLRFESCQVLLWALGLINMNWPTESADTDGLLRIIRDADTEMLIKIAKPRPLSAVLSMHDVTCRLHSICVRTDEAELARMGLDHDIVYERHYALNWLLTADGICDWDLVIPKT